MIDKEQIDKWLAEGRPPALIEAFRRFAARKARIARKAPSQGIYWWVPQGNDWSLFAYDENFYPDPHHMDIWERVLSRIIMPKAPPEFRYAYAGLPRGRIANWNGQWRIFHGNDTPGGDARLRRVMAEFNLPMNNTVTMFDDHEVMLPADYHVVKRTMGYKQMVDNPPQGDEDYGLDMDNYTEGDDDLYDSDYDDGLDDDPEGYGRAASE